MLLGRIDVASVRKAFGADVREFALLWLVFAVLDVLVVDRLTVKWFAGNLVIAVLLWCGGAYIEFERSREHETHG